MWASIAAVAIISSPLPGNDDVARVSSTAAWLNLLHYRRSAFGGLESDIDDDRFFVSPRGMRDPAAELEASIRLLREEAARMPGEVLDKAAFGCRFPARLQLLREAFPVLFSGRSQTVCHEFIRFRRRINARSVQVVFSSYYLGNPVSAFGHTFLKFAQELGPGPTATDLIDETVNYSAHAQGVGAISYIALGLGGGFTGRFGVAPYHRRVREYNHYELRDLWIYDLALAPAETRRLVAHVWELGQTTASYYFLTRNCSYFVLTMLEAAAPRLALTSNLRIAVVPSDTLKTLTSTPGLVTRTSYRPSPRSTFRWRYGRADSAVRDELFQLLADSPESAAGESSVEAVQLTLSYLDWKHPDRGAPSAGIPAPHVALRRKLLARRAGRVARNPGPPHSARLPPHLAHRSSLISLHGGADPDGGFAEVRARIAQHDGFDPQAGYPRGAELAALDTVVRFRLSETARLERLDLVRAAVLGSTSALSFDPSWGLVAGLARSQGSAPSGRLFGRVAAGAGLGAGWGSIPSISGFARMVAGLRYAPSFGAWGFQAVWGPSTGIAVQPATNTLVVVRARIVADALRFSPSRRASVVLTQSLGDSWAMSGGYAIEASTWHSTLALNRYF